MPPLQAHPPHWPRCLLPLQTPARLEALLRWGVDVAVQIPPHCMTRDALLLARELYAGDPTWDARDERCSQPLAQPTAPVWNCLLTPEQALHAVWAGVPLCDVPHWLRADALEQAALDADIANLAHLAPSQITPALAQRAVLHANGRLIRHVPCRAAHASVVPGLGPPANGLTLQDIPPPLRSLEVRGRAGRPARHVPPGADRTGRGGDHRADRQRPGPRPRAGRTARRQRLACGAGLGATGREPTPGGCGRRPARACRDASAPARPLRAGPRLPGAGPHRAGGAGRVQRAVAAVALPAQHGPPQKTRAGSPPLARWHMGHADEATLIRQLALHPQTLADMPRARITPAMVDAALAADPATVRWVPKRLMTPAHYAVALRVGVKRPEDVPPAMVMARGLELPRHSPLPAHRPCLHHARCKQSAVRSPCRGSSPATSRHPACGHAMGLVAAGHRAAQRRGATPPARGV